MYPKERTVGYTDLANKIEPRHPELAAMLRDVIRNDQLDDGYAEGLTQAERMSYTEPREQGYAGAQEAYRRPDGLMDTRPAGHVVGEWTEEDVQRELAHHKSDNHSAIDLDQPELLRAIQHEKPSKVHKSDLYVARVVRRSGGDIQIYEDVKHLWWTADSSVLVIVQYTNTERTAWRNICWLREVIDWYTLTHQEFE
jgi:hypothetical protein